MADHVQPITIRRLSRGGARNLRTAERWQLKERDCLKVLAACEAAYDKQAPMTRWITLAWEGAGIDPIDCGPMTAEFLNLQRDWLRSRGLPMPWCWTLETGSKYGAHAHLLAHVPPSLDLLYRPMPRRWVKNLLGGAYISGTLKCEALQFRAAAYNNPDAYWAELQGKIHYMLKTAPFALESKLGMTGWSHVEWGQRCKTYGKRAGVWQFRSGQK